jgi:two-component system CheB/CheR fusion protein
MAKAKKPAVGSPQKPSASAAKKSGGSAKSGAKAKKTAGRKKSAEAITEPVPKLSAAASFPIVGIGASAGGLEALEELLKSLPADSGMAFIVIQHLDPSHKGMMPELLQRATPMQVTQAKNRMKVMPNCIYVIPPNKDLSILHGRLQLLEPVATRGLHLPIDFFFRALAEDRRERSIGVILSGMGSDGTLGLRAIKEKAGLVVVQDPGSAKFDSMPKSAIDAGLADIIATPQEIPGHIIDFMRHAPHVRAAYMAERDIQKGALEQIFILLRARTGHDFSQYKKSTVYRRIERRMGLHQLKKIAAYVRYLRENPQEAELLFKELLIGVTSFFRDPDAWQHLKDNVLPELLAANKNGKPMRAWVVGCSTGEEAYSLAMLFREAVEQIGPRARATLQIFGTDLDADAIEIARQGFYPANIAADVSAERLKRFFVEDGTGYRVGKEIREMVVFAPQNVIMDPPFTKLEILCCRNLLIYLSNELQKRLLPLFHYCLNPGGVLFLGSAETIGGFTGMFRVLDSKSRLYRRTVQPVHPTEVEFPSRTQPVHAATVDVREPAVPVPNLQELTDNLLLQRFTPAAVLVNGEGDILYISGLTGKYLEPAAGKANWNIYVMAREGLRQELALLLPMALRDKKTLSQSGIRVKTNGSWQMIRLRVHPIERPEALAGTALIAFDDLKMPEPEPPAPASRSSSGGRSAQLEQSLKKAREEIRSFREEMQTQQEELKSANEELQSTNEELQSTNEELTTSKEELQSLNEELQTVNAELQSKVDDLSSVNNDMKNLLNSTDIATIFLDNRLHVRRFTKQAAEIFKLLPGDVGRPLSDIVSVLDYPSMQEDADEVLRSLAFSEKQVSASDGRWLRVKIMPYRTLENVIDGVVITFTDITHHKNLEDELRKALTKARSTP